MRRVLQDLGDTLLKPLAGDVDADREIGGVAIHDPIDDQALPANALVLGVGLASVEPLLELIDELGRQRAVGLVVRAQPGSLERLRPACQRNGLVLLGLTRGASWTQLAALLRSLLGEGDVGVAEPETIGGLPAGDLFALANAVAALLDAPVTIEDRMSRVLAFSGRQDEADSSRVETILGRQVPEKYARVLAERGVFEELQRSAEPVYVDSLPLEGVELPRVAMAARAGDELLGSIWAAVREPLSKERTHALKESAKLVALHLLRVRAGSDVERRLRADLVGTALEGGVAAREALSRLGLSGQPLLVLALSVADSAGSADAETVSERQRLGDAFAMHLSAVHPRSAAALVGDVAYALLPLTGDGEDAEQRGRRIATDFAERVGERLPAVLAIGPVAHDLAGLARARGVADRVLRVLREQRGTVRVAALTDVHVETLMTELRDIVAARGDQPTGAVARLIAYDTEHGSCLVQTLRAWLDEFGDVNAAAASVYVHPNTFRYRLRRLAEVGQLDLTDAESRFAAMLQLRTVVGR